MWLLLSQGHAAISGHGLGGSGHSASPPVNPMFGGQSKAGRDEPSMAPAVAALPLHSESLVSLVAASWSPLDSKGAFGFFCQAGRAEGADGEMASPTIPEF